jgi:hypothetical protein
MLAAFTAIKRDGTESTKDAVDENKSAGTPKDFFRMLGTPLFSGRHCHGTDNCLPSGLDQLMRIDYAAGGTAFEDSQ